MSSRGSRSDSFIYYLRVMIYMSSDDSDKIVIKTEGGRTYASGLNAIETIYFQELLKQRLAPEEAAERIEEFREFVRKHRGS